MVKALLNDLPASRVSENCASALCVPGPVSFSRMSIVRVPEPRLVSFSRKRKLPSVWWDDDRIAVWGKGKPDF